MVLMVRSDHPAKSVQEFLSQARQRPGKINAGYGSSSSQISIAVLNKLGKLDSMPVPYKGIPLAVNDVIGGQLEFTFVDTANAIAQSKGGKLRALGITAANRSHIVPDWPALSESMPGFDITAWFAVLGPANMPREVVEKLNQSINQVLRQNDTNPNWPLDPSISGPCRIFQNGFAAISVRNEPPLVLYGPQDRRGNRQ